MTREEVPEGLQAATGMVGSHKAALEEGACVIRIDTKISGTRD